MYPGWVTIGDSPLDTADFRELFNNARAYAYAENAGICWLEPCTECEAAAATIPGGGVYTSPIVDNAPWYDPENPDTWGFLGVVGLEVVGDESSTRTATVSSTITAGGVIGPAYYGPRTLVFRGIAIAEDECSLKAGLDWMRYSQGATLGCEGDTLTFFDCCPCVCADDSHGGPCWAETYEELAEKPESCAPEVWWPTTYEELREGPPAYGDGDTDWCDWISNYRELRDGLPAYACCFEDCVQPYVRTYRNARVTSGPTVLRHPAMFSNGAMVEFEITIVAADPTEYAVPNRRIEFETGDLTPVEVEDPEPPDPPVNPYAPLSSGAALLLSMDAWTGPVATTWNRVSADFFPAGGDLLLQQLSLTVQIANFSGGDSGEVRVGVWDLDGELLIGWYLPEIIENTAVSLDSIAGRATTVTGTTVFTVPTARAYDGAPAEWHPVGNGSYVITIDQPPADEVNLEVTVIGTPTGSP